MSAVEHLEPCPEGGSEAGRGVHSERAEWGGASAQDSSAICQEPLEAKPLTEKEGFEPSIQSKSLVQGLGFERKGSAPVDEALLAKVRAITSRSAEVVE